MAVLTRPHARLSYLDEGAGAPPIVFVHGFACDHTDWNQQLSHFRPRHRVLALDLRGHGASQAVAERCSFETLAGDVPALMRELDLKRTLLVGHSMGCRVVLQAWCDVPDRIAGLVLLDGSVVAQGESDAQARMREHIDGLGTRAFIEALYNEALLPDSAAGRAIMARAVSLDPEIGARLFASLAGWDATRMQPTLASVQVPLLAIQSTYLNTARKRVRLGARESSPWLDLLRAQVAHVQIEIVAGPGHFHQIEAPEPVNRLIEEFAARL